MQKQVSKQSLAVLALSILLAISMALTATFAAFKSTGSATGTITFTESGITLTMAVGEDNSVATISGNAVTVTLDASDFVVTADGKMYLTATAIADLAKITYAVDYTEGSNVAGYKITVTEQDGADYEGVIALAATTENLLTADKPATAVFSAVAKDVASAIEVATLSGSFTINVSADIIVA